MEKLVSVFSHAKAIVEDVLKSQGMRPEEISLYFYWKEIVGEEYSQIFSVDKIETVETTHAGSKIRLHVMAAKGVNTVELSYHVHQIKTSIHSYFGFEFIDEVKIKAHRKKHPSFGKV